MLNDWMQSYLRAWESNDPADIGALFAVDALYYTEPSAEPWRGSEAIIEGWLARRDEPGDATFTWQPLVESPDVAVITGNATYGDRSYSNLWVIRFDSDGRCREFTEWWMRHDGQSASAGP